MFIVLEVETMAYTEAGKRATIKYIKTAYDRVEIKIPKGNKAVIEAAAKEAGESVNQYVQKAIMDRMNISEWPVIVEESKSAGE